MSFPMPNSTLNGRTVVASAWYVEEDDDTEVAVLVLNGDQPFYAVEFWKAEPDGTPIDCYEWITFPNICNAAALWSEICGVDCSATI